MTEEPTDYESKYNEIVAERDSLSNALNNYIAENNKLKADLKVSQQINRMTVGTDTKPVESDVPKTVTLSELIREYKNNMMKEVKQ